MRVLFMGTPEFACPSLKAIIEASCFDVIGVFTQPDRPKGRGKVIQPPPIKRMAQSFNLCVFQPQGLNKSAIGELWSQLRPQVVVVVAYGLILPAWILHSPALGCINLHASLLPLYRGAAPINWAIINGDKETGVTSMLMDEGMDTGPILMQEKTPIQPQDTAQTLHERLSLLGGGLIVKTLKEYAQGRIIPTKQAEGVLVPAPKLDREIGRLDWSMGNYSLWNLIRGINPSPGAFTFLKGKMLKIWRCVPLMEEDALKPVKNTKGNGKEGLRGLSDEPGLVLGFDPDLGLIIQTGDGRLALQEVQVQGKNRMSAQAFINGCRFEPVGELLKRFPNQS